MTRTLTRSCFKRIFVIFMLLLYPLMHISAENLQLVMPRIIYIGDTVEIRYIFHSEAPLFGGEFENPQAKCDLRTDYSTFIALNNDFKLKTATLEKLNTEYTLSLSLIPWKTGFLQIPPFNLSSVVAFSQGTEALIPFIVTLTPIEVKSLVTKTGKRSFLPQATPLTLPGTTAMLVIFSIIAFFLFVALLYALLHLPKIARFLENLSYLYSLKKNSRKAIKKLTALQKNSGTFSSDKALAAEIQHILRDFLTNRFGTDFSSVTTTKIAPLFSEILGGDLSEHQGNTVEELLSLFNRLDYIRFSENGGFLREDGGEDEGNAIIGRAVCLIADFDTEDEES